MKNTNETKDIYSFFACSDIHSAYTPWMDALKKAGFDENNEFHKIIICGDAFDRLDESQKVFEFIEDMLNKDKLIYVKGNHEYLLTECLKRKVPLYHDFHNGTIKTILDLKPKDDDLKFHKKCAIIEPKIKELLSKTVDYYETEQYVFVHSRLPITKDGKFDPRWRKASKTRWEESRWSDPFLYAQKGFVPKDKTLVFGHWHTSKMRAKETNGHEFGKTAKFDPYFGENYIGLDGCVVASNIVNVVVLKDKLL